MKKEQSIGIRIQKALADAEKSYKECKEYKNMKYHIEQMLMALDILEGRYKGDR